MREKEEEEAPAAMEATEVMEDTEAQEVPLVHTRLLNPTLTRMATETTKLDIER